MMDVKCDVGAVPHDSTSPRFARPSCQEGDGRTRDDFRRRQHCHRFRFTPLLLAILATLAPSASAESIQQQRQSGPVSIEVTLEPKEPVIGDTLTLSIEVTAEKDVEVLMPDFGDALDRFSIVDFAPRETIDDAGRTVAKQTYRLDPPSSGRHVIPPILIEYVDRRPGQQQAPEGLDAYEVLTDRIPFDVASVLPDDAAVDLKPPMERLAPIQPPAPSRWPIVVAMLVLALVSLPFVWRAIAAARRRKRRRSAYDVATARLNKLLREPRSTGPQIDEFYVGLSYIIRKYIEDRFEMRAPELTTEEFLASIGQSPDFSADHQSLLREFLRQADLVKFARAQPSGDEIERAIGNVQRFLEDTRENAPMISDESAESDSEHETPPESAGPKRQIEEAAHG
ncbi:DUF4381 family protein [Stieleria sp. ICT_E10.1]|uniref:DUF4381 family protein n=1 Tax=Stieleria sedimenti TaxID=2976331 RepID=UPI00218085BF|nr:DUF4381 family protein [Stieleria sedimenti]MCS7469735.1 DUF4381 family protein [Stieleria sedimenti]